MVSVLVEHFRGGWGLGLLGSCGKGVHHTSRVDQSCTSIDRNRHSQRFGDLFCGRSVLARRMDVCRDAPVALACDTHRKRNQFARLRVEPSGLCTGVTQLAIAAHGLRAEPPEIANGLQQLLAILIPVEHHRPPPSCQLLRELSESPKRIAVIVNPENDSFLGGEVPPQPASSAGDALPQHCQVIEIRVAELRQLFNAIDPSPFRQRDLDPRVEEFIVDWASDLPADKPWALLVHLNRPAGRADEAAALREAIHEYFGQRVIASKRKLRELFRRGRISLVIALAFLTASIAISDAVAAYLGGSRLGGVIREGFVIGGWVAMWRPLEVFLYDWWPIRAEGRLLQRLGTMPVRIEYKETAPADAWRSDWPEVQPQKVQGAR